MQKSAIRLVMGLFIVLFVTAGCGNRLESADAALSSAGYGGADKQQSGALNQLNQLSEQLYTAAQAGNRQLAYTHINRLQLAAGKASIRRLGTTAGWRAFDNNVKKMRDILERKKAGSEGYIVAAKLKLAVDAISRPDSPLWLQYHEVLVDDWTRMRKAWQASSDSRMSGAVASLHVYRMHVERLEIAALMGHKDKPLMLLQEQLHHMGQLLDAAYGANSIESYRILAAFSALEETSAWLFDEALAAEAELGAGIPFHQSISVEEWLALFFIAGFILVILAYAIWRKYAYEQAHGSPASYQSSNWERKR
ncbi:hypothetical protein PAECIP111893_04390 [Paenibacillus plantiphilus]|uniref:Sporulation protein YpjB n=1 Tax=Paenibacillus plantiphilus TaxID=2905650 RepID=A0ABN8GYT0_9BACL|nr:sporulation protein YpjB [Paenibacillus plantiphilus]CAH1218309.1 hypothetical protein PAECIP111893_04390 [Paenibacillus plantiphilus]